MIKQPAMYHGKDGGTQYLRIDTGSSATGLTSLSIPGVTADLDNIAVVTLSAVVQTTRVPDPEATDSTVAYLFFDLSRHKDNLGIGPHTVTSRKDGDTLTIDFVLASGFVQFKGSYDVAIYTK